MSQRTAFSGSVIPKDVLYLFLFYNLKSTERCICFSSKPSTAYV